MILFRLPPDHATAGGIGRTYAMHMAAALTGHGHPATVTDRPAQPGDIIIADGLVLSSANDPACTVALLHHAASRAPGPDRQPTEQTLAGLLPRVRRVICTSASTAARVHETYGVTARVVMPGASVRPRAVPPAGPLPILSAGVLTRRKGYDALLAALSRLMDLDWTLTIAGHTGRDPAWEQALLAQAASLGDRVHWVHNPDRAALDTLFATAGLFVLLTRWEGYPAAMAEALGRAIPCVGTSAAYEGLPEHAGIVVTTDDAATLSKVLRRAVADAGLRAQMAQNAIVLPSWADQAALFAAAIA